ncbi:MAG TPA: urease accessory protein UreD [Methanoregula sp.]|nr:urease accessory protein UreD [Methanoregula sp.]
MPGDLLEHYRGLPSPFSLYEAEKPRLAIGSAGKTGIARLRFAKTGEKTYLSDVFNQIPARVVRPLYYDPNRPGMPYLIFVNPTGGIVQGDRYEYRFQLDEGAEAFITDSMATKVYKMDLNYASRRADVYLAPGSRLEYLPREIIAFADSRWHQDIAFHLAGDARLYYSEIFCPGRIARDEFWEFSIFSSKMLIEKEGRPVLIDNLLFGREDKEASPTLFGNKSFLLSAYWYSEDLPDIRERIGFGEIYAGISRMPYGSGYVIKALSDNLEELRELQLKIWSVFREHETGAPAPQLRMY